MYGKIGNKRSLSPKLLFCIIQKLEEEKSDMEGEVRAKEDLLRAVEEDSGIHSHITIIIIIYRN